MKRMWEWGRGREIGFTYLFIYCYMWSFFSRCVKDKCSFLCIVWSRIIKDLFDLKNKLHNFVKINKYIFYFILFLFSLTRQLCFMCHTHKRIMLSFIRTLYWGCKRHHIESPDRLNAQPTRNKVAPKRRLWLARKRQKIANISIPRRRLVVMSKFMRELVFISNMSSSRGSHFQWFEWTNEPVNKSWLVTCLILLPHIPALCMTSRLQTGEHKMVAPLAVTSR